MRDGDKMVVIGAQIIESEAQITADGTLEDRLKRAMKAGKNLWLSTDDDIRFRASIGAVLITASEDERERVSAELAPLKMLSAAINGVAVDFGALAVPENPIGLLKMWREID